MTPTESNPKPVRRAKSGAENVEAFLAALEHPFKAEILALRRIILGADAGIQEEIKWNVPSFYTTEHFATFHLRSKEGVQVVLHLGAKKRADSSPDFSIDDPQGLLAWLSKERALITFRDMQEVAAKGAAFTEIIRQWIRQV